MAQHEDDPGLTPEQEAHVRRLLADARHTDPTPDRVVARLDRVLAGLADEPAREATVVRLADRRRRAATMLVAAAASVAAVIGVGQIVSDTGFSGGADLATTAEDAGEAAVPEAVEGESEDPRNGVNEDQAAASAARKQMPFELQSEQFARDAEALQFDALDSALTDADDQEGAPVSGFRDLARARGRTVCDPGAWGRGSYVAVLYDGAEGWVVLRRPRGDTQIADLFLCGSEEVVRSVTLPFP